MTTPVKLNLWVMPNAGFDTRRVIQRELAVFRKENPGYDVNLTVHPWFFSWDRIIAVTKRREIHESPDVIQIGGTWNTTLAALGAITEVTDYLNDIDRNDVIRPTWNYAYEPTRTKAYSLPWFIDARVLYYRRDLLAQLGTTADSLKTWEGLRRACERLRDDKKLSKRYFAMPLAGQREGILIHDLAPWIWGAGGNFLNSDRQFVQFHEPSALQGINFYYMMMVDHLIPMLGRDRLAPGNFFTGHFAFQVSGAWPATTYLNSRYAYANPDVVRNYGIAAFPSGPAGQVTYLGGSNLAIVGTSPHPEAAWKLIKFLTSSPSQVRHSRAIGMLPSRYTALEQLLSAARPEVAEVFRQSLRVARTLPCAATLGAVERILGRASQHLMNAVREGRYSDKILSEEMAAAAKEADYILSLYE